MTNHTIQIGDMSVTVLVDGLYEDPATSITHLSSEDARQLAIKQLGTDVISIPVNCFLIEREGQRILVDCGAGTGWGTAYGKARSQLSEMGIEPQDISTILITHMHGDHALGLIEQDEAYFPKATVYVPLADWSFYSDERNIDKVPSNARGAFDVTARVAKAYSSKVIAVAPGEVLPDITLVSLPGHTPGHSGYRLQGNDQSLLLWGDALHIASLQSKDPEIGMIYDLQRDIAVATRRTILETLSNSGDLVAGGHISGIMRVERRAVGFDLEPV